MRAAGVGGKKEKEGGGGKNAKMDGGKRKADTVDEGEGEGDMEGDVEVKKKQKKGGKCKEIKVEMSDAEDGAEVA